MSCETESTLLMAVLVTAFYNSTGYPFEVGSGSGTFELKHSVSQTQNIGTLQKLFIPGQTLLDTPETSIINDRFQCEDYAMTLSVADPKKPGKLYLSISLPGKVNTNDNPKCKILWGDGITDDDERIENNPTVFNHEYSEFGIYDVSINCKDDHNKEDGVKCPIQYSQCFKDVDFFDNSNRKFDNPVFFFSTDPIQIDSYMEITDTTCITPIINWRIIIVDEDSFVSFENFTQPNSTVFALPKQTLKNGIYVIALEVQFPSKSIYEWTEDLFIVKVVDLELVSYITGGDYLEFPYGNELHIYADKSYDPLNETNLLEPLHATWSFVVFSSSLPLANLNYFLLLFPVISLPSPYLVPHEIYEIKNGTDYILKVDTSIFIDYSYCMAVFSLSRGSRMASAMQIVRLISNVLPMSIECVYNCHIGRDKLFYFDRLELDLNISSRIDTTNFTFYWYINVWKPAYAAFLPDPDIVTDTGLDTSSLSIQHGSLVQGNTYQIIVYVYSPSHSVSTAQLVKTVNYVPSGGTCQLDAGKTTVTSAREWLTFACESWIKTDAITKVTDYNPILSFTLRQITVGAKVENEPILHTRSKKSFVILKAGDPKNHYLTDIVIRVTDIYNNYQEQILQITSLPAFAVSDVGPNEAGAAIVRSYTEIDYPFDEQQLDDMGKSDMMITLVSAVCSNIHLIDLGEWEPPVPRVLNSDGYVMDLNANGNKDVGNLDDVIKDADNETLDPATLAIQDVMARMVNFTRTIVENDLNGSRSGDKMLASLVTNAFTNLVAQPRYLNYESMINIIYLARIVGFDALFPQNSTGDDAAQTETSSGEIYYMFQEIVQASVPDDFVEIRPVGNLASGRNNIDEMLLALAKNISLYDSELSPVERAYLYVRMQKHLKYNTEEKKKTAKEAADMTKDLAQEVQNQWKLCRRCSNVRNKKTEQLLKNQKSDHFVTQMTDTATSKFRIDGLDETLTDVARDSFNTVSVSAFEFQENVYMYDDDSTSSFVTSKVLRIDIKSAEKRVTPGYMTFQQNVMTPVPEHVIPVVSEEDVSEFMYHKFIYQKSTDELCMIIEPQAQYNFTEYLVYIKFSSVPSIIDFDFNVHVKEELNWKTCILPAKMRNHTGLTYMAVQLPGDMKNVPYNLTIVTVGCLTWEEKISKWHTDKCELEWKPDENIVSCFCRALTDLVFSNSFFVAPNSIDFSSVFLRFSPLSQAAVIGTFSALFVCYIVGVVFLSRLDRQDCLKWGITPLRDNMINDDNYYVIKVFTGMRRGAGTKSRVAFILTGSYGNTGPRELYDGIREEFSTGSVMSFFMATKKPLGDLLHLYIWHDNSGGSRTEWYLNQIVIYDIQTFTTYTFVAERWLSVDTNIDACLPSSSCNQPIKFESRFFFQLRDRFSENHTWISILYRPQTSTFSRVQRLSCALAFIFLTMLANAMYFNPEPNYVSPAILEVGPFRFTKQQIYISIICAAITTPPIMFMVYIFQHTRRRKQNEQDHTKKSSRCCRTRGSGTDEDRLREIQLSSETPELKGGLIFPFWFVYFGWLLVLATIGVSAFFIVLYSIEWGKQKSEEWLTTFFMSIFESVLFVDPVLVICIVFVLSLLLRTNKLDKNIDMEHIVERYKQITGYQNDELKSAIKVLQSIKSDFDSLRKDPRRVTPPLQGHDLALAAENHRNKIVMTSFAKDILLNMFLIIILFSIAYSNRDSKSYLHHEEIVNAIVEPWKMPQFHSIKTPSDMYNWLNSSVIPSLFPEFDINGAPLHWTVRQFTNGYNNLRLGPPRLRQLRINNRTCDIPYFGQESCYGKYKILDDEERNFCLGWSTPPCPASETVFNISSSAWKYTSAFDIWGIPTTGIYTTYIGGGYIATFDVSRNISIEMLNELFKNLWIDRKTRAVVFEFTLYNAVTNIFIYNIFLVEFLESGGALNSYSIYPIRVYTHHGAMGTYTLVCEVIFIVYLVVTFVKICVRIYQKRFNYFKKFWYVYELCMLLTGIVVVVFYALRLSFANSTINNFNKDKKLFVDFGHIVLWDQMLVTVLAILVFISTLRMLEVFASSKKINAVIQVFNDCSKDLLWFGVTFLYIFIAFSVFGLLLFGSKLSSYKDIFNTMGTLFIALIGKSKFTEIDDKEPVFAKLFFWFYILTVVFFVLSIFLSILGASIDSAVHSSRHDPREDLVEHVIKSVKSLFFKPSQKPAIFEEMKSPSPIIAEEKIEDTSSVYTETSSREYSGLSKIDNISEDPDVISKMSEEFIPLPIIKVKRVPKFRSKTQFSTRSLKLKERPPWRP